VPEVQIFIIKLKGTELNHEVLTVIDKAIPLPIIFELHSSEAYTENKVKIVAAYKLLPELNTYFESSWLAKSTPRSALPISLTMQGLYEQIIRSLLPLGVKKNESLAQQIKRIKQIHKLEKSISKLNKNLNNEKQFKNKIKINGKVKDLEQQLELLI